MRKVAWFIIFVAVCYYTKCSSWTIAPKPMLERIALSQIGYDSDSSTVYVFGGFNDTNQYGECSAQIWKWNVSDLSNSWAQLNEQQTPYPCFFSEMQNSVQIGNLLWFVGINNGTNNINGAHVNVFNLQSEEFINNNNIEPIPIPSIRGCVATNNSHIFMTGGWQNQLNQYVNALQILNIKTGKWTVRHFNDTYDNLGLTHQFCSCVNNSLFVFGGMLPQGYVNGIYKYNVLSEQWMFIGNLSRPTADGWAVYSYQYNQIYLVCSHGGIEIFNLNDHSLIDLEEYSMPIKVNKAPVVIINDTIMVFGGIMDNSLNFNQYSSLVQMVHLPLISNHQTCGKSKSYQTLFIITICVLFIMVIGGSVGGYLYGIKYRKDPEGQYVQQK